MHGVAVRLTRTVLPRGLKTPPSSTLTRRAASRSHTRSLRLLGTPGVTGEEGRVDTAGRVRKSRGDFRANQKSLISDDAVTHTVGHNSVATVDAPRESVLEGRGNTQPEYPLRGILAL